jgi:hypothetical protein
MFDFIIKESKDPKINTCIKLLNMIGSAYAEEAWNAITLLNARLTKFNLSIEQDLAPYYSEAKPLFGHILTRMKVLSEEESFAYLRREAYTRNDIDIESSDAWKYDQDTDPGPDYYWRKTFTRRSKSDHTKILEIPGKWQKISDRTKKARSRPRREEESNKFDSTSIREDCLWIEEQVYDKVLRNGKTKTVYVRGYQRRKKTSNLQKTLDN